MLGYTDVFASAPLLQNAGDYVFTAGGLDNVITMVCHGCIIYLHSLSDFFRTAFTDLEPVLD